MLNLKISTSTNKILAILFACWLFCPTANAGLLGKTLSIGLYTSSSLSTLVSGTSLTTFTVTNSEEISSWWQSSSGFFVIDVTDTTINLYNRLEADDRIPTTATRYVGFKDVNNAIDDFSSTLTTLIHTVTNVDATDLVVTADSIGLRITNANFPARTPDGYVSIQVGYATTTPTPTPVPEPVSLSLLAPFVTGLILRKRVHRMLPQT